MWSPTYQITSPMSSSTPVPCGDLINQYMNPYLEDITPGHAAWGSDTTVNNLPVEVTPQPQTGQAAGMPPKGQTTD